MYLLDTDTCIGVLRGHEGVVSRMQLQSPVDLAIASMTLAELWFGAVRSGGGPAAFEKVKRFLSPGIAVLPFDEAAAYRYAEIRNAVRAQPIGTQDMVIASVGLARGLTVVTAHLREFSRVPGLVVESWI
jgi:tRNA(fMet)-specific endonuclease VapC